ncbi:hypothetical protein NDU88_006693 [Pleurodeles waltl]|uniref:Reverse transcriptase domain-containing protein n=1 Tax=Pleurodeles waltl TaxID=8319 RepID=A0AAV7RST5_PLEWA|nr:hypothetical protein NDU88_006693 [Pleurodeles waltl]
MGKRVVTLERKEDGQNEEIEWLQQEALHLQEQQIDPQAHTKDLENRSWGNNIYMRGVPAASEGPDLDVYLRGLFGQILGEGAPPELIEPDQAGLIKVCQSSNNTKRIVHLIDKVQRARQEALLLSIDAEKVFDRAHWPCLFATLRRFGFGARVCQWVGHIYNAPRDLLNLMARSQHHS